VGKREGEREREREGERGRERERERWRGIIAMALLATRSAGLPKVVPSFTLIWSPRLGRMISTIELKRTSIRR